MSEVEGLNAIIARATVWLNQTWEGPEMVEAWAAAPWDENDDGPAEAGPPRPEGAS